MRQFKILGVAFGAALVVAACGGGGGDGNQAPAVAYTSVVSFGDSLSDAGTYRAGVTANVLKAAGGGQFTVNGIGGAIGADSPPTYTFAQLISAAAVGSPSCAARTGGFGFPETVVAKCTNYGQGGARVTSPFGVGNSVGAGFIKGPLTEPVVTQVANYLIDANNGGKFTGKELVTVLAGANDIFGQTDILKAGVVTAAANALVTSLVTQLIAGLAPANQATAAPAIQLAAGTAAGAAIATESAKPTASLTSIITAATNAATPAAAQAAGIDAATSVPAYANPNLANAAAIGATAGAAAGTAAAAFAAPSGNGPKKAVAGMVTAAGELVASIKGMIANGATHVVVSNLPDVSQTPAAMATIVYNADGTIKDNSQQQLILSMTTAFNQALQAGLTGNPAVVLADTFAENQRQFLNPAHWALTNVKDTACNLAFPANLLASSLVCNASNLIAGDTTHYLFADGAHPTPYGHKLLSQFVIKQMILAGWL